MHCPFIDSGDIRCKVFHTLQNIDKALGRCAGDYLACRVYRRKISEPLSGGPFPIRFAH